LLNREEVRGPPRLLLLMVDPEIRVVVVVA